MPERVRLVEALGLVSLRDRLRDVRTGLRGDAFVKPSRFDRSSLSLLWPRFAVPLWLGRQPVRRKVVLTALFNHRPTPIEDGWSVRRRSVLDHRGRDLTYDSHNGTDLAVPPGTVVVAPAPARVLRVSMELHRGGLKVLLDHGGGLLTSYSHLARVERAVGDVLQRGERFALSGMSGMDGIAAFPWLPPHVHFNVWVGPSYVDPFGDVDRPTLWRTSPPTPWQGEASEPWQSSDWDLAAVDRVIDGCRDAAAAARLRSEPQGWRRAGQTFFELAYFPTRFSDRSSLFGTVAPPSPRLHLPVRAEDFDGVVFADEL